MKSLRKNSKTTKKDRKKEQRVVNETEQNN